MEEAASRGLKAVSSQRSDLTCGTQRIHNLCKQMKPHATVPTVREFLEQARDLM